MLGSGEVVVILWQAFPGVGMENNYDYDHQDLSVVFSFFSCIYMTGMRIKMLESLKKGFNQENLYSPNGTSPNSGAEKSWWRCLYHYYILNLPPVVPIHWSEEDHSEGALYNDKNRSQN